MADDKTDNDPPLIERWLAEQQQWQRTLLTYSIRWSRTTISSFISATRCAARCSRAKPYPTAAAAGAAAPETPADDTLDQMLFAVHQIEGQMQDLR